MRHGVGSKAAPVRSPVCDWLALIPNNQSWQTSSCWGDVAKRAMVVGSHARWLAATMCVQIVTYKALTGSGLQGGL
jgi:hypothetical protein